MVISQAQAAKELGVSEPTVSDLIILFGISTKPVPSNGKAKGLDLHDMALIRRKLGIKKAKPAQASAH